MEIPDEFLKVVIAACSDQTLAFDCPVPMATPENPGNGVCWWEMDFAPNQIELGELLEKMQAHIERFHPNWKPNAD